MPTDPQAKLALTYLGTVTTHFGLSYSNRSFIPNYIVQITSA